MKLVLTRTGMVAGVAALIGCSVGMGGECAMRTRTIEAVLREHTRELMSLPGVVGTARGLCSGQPCIKVYVAAKTLELERRVPANLEGYPVSVEETGAFRPLERGSDFPK